MPKERTPTPRYELIWLSTAQAADVAGRHQDTVRRAAESGELHAGQSRPGASWRIHRDCLNAWLLGEACPHRQEDRS